MHEEYMDASSTDMEHMEGLIKEHKEAKPMNSYVRLQEPTTIPFERNTLQKEKNTTTNRIYAAPNILTIIIEK